MEQPQQPLLQNSKNCTIRNSDVEGQCKVLSITPIRLSKDRVGLGVLISLVTALLFALACSWSKRLTKKFFFQNCRLDDATHFWILNEDKSFNIVKRITTSNSISFFNRKLRYIYCQEQSVFQPLEFTVDDKANSSILETMIKGIKDYQQCLSLYGPCKIEIPIPSVFAYLLKELTAPFYILQYVTCVLWVAEGITQYQSQDYLIFAVVMITVSFSISCLNYVLLISSVKKLRDLARHKNNVKVIRQPNAAPVAIDSEALVPGDVLVVEAKMTVPCDCLILTGELMMNEASLTGESVPIAKEGLQNNENIFSFAHQKKNCLFEGTKVLLTKPTVQHYVLALVIRTGFCSFKGQIFRSVLYPKPQKFAFYTQAIKFLSGLAVFILLVYFVELYKYIEMEFSSLMIAFRFGDAITWIIPPALPIFVSMCMTYSLLRLRKEHRIFGVDSQKTLIAGQVNTVCFDKTGTLTTTSIEVFGYQQIETHNNVRILSQPILAFQVEDKSTLVFKLLASCHGVAKIDGEMLGDSLDVEMLNFSGYTIEETDDPSVKLRVKGATELDILKNHEFESSLQRMSVLVRDNSNGRYYVFCKGSPEKIHDLSVNRTIPHNFKAQLDILTMKGLRVLGLGYREVDQADVHLLTQAPRSDMEMELDFLGLLIMQNKLKSDTAHVISELSQSGLDLKIISGDNGLTTIQCARECNILDPMQPMLLVDYNDRAKQLTLEEIDQSSAQELRDEQPSTSFSEDTQSSNGTNTNDEIMQKLIKHLLKSNHTIKGRHLEQKLKPSINDMNTLGNLADHYGFALTGKAFDYFWAQSPQTQYVGKKSSFAGFDDPLLDVSRLDISNEQVYRLVFSAIIEKARIFARMRPEQKSQIIEQLQSQGRTVLMIGDGANDCAAIKQANVGVSFAQSDASYAAPFSTDGLSISCVKIILLDGRAALSNAIEVFQYYLLVSVIKYIGAMLLALQAEMYSTLQMISVNYVASLPFVKAICLSRPCDKLSHRIPEDDMVRVSNQVTIYFHILITSIGLLLNYLYWHAQEWHTQVSKSNNGTYIQEGQVQTTLFVCGLVYYQASLISLYISKPFKQRLYTHKWIMGLMVIMSVIILVMFFSYQDWMYNVMSLWDLQQYGNYMSIQFLISVSVSVVMVATQELVIKRFVPCNKPLFEMNQKPRKHQVGLR